MSALTKNTSSWCANWQITKSHPNCKSKQHVSAKAPGLAHCFFKTWLTGISIIYWVTQIQLFQSEYGFAPCFTLKKTQPSSQPCSSPARAEPCVCPWPKYSTPVFHTLNLISQALEPRAASPQQVPLKGTERLSNFSVFRLHFIFPRTAQAMKAHINTPIQFKGHHPGASPTAAAAGEPWEGNQNQVTALITKKVDKLLPKHQLPSRKLVKEVKTNYKSLPTWILLPGSPEKISRICVCYKKNPKLT